MPVLFGFLKDGGACVALIKPQFEAGKERVGKKGVVRDKNVHLAVIDGILDFAPSVGMTVMGLDFSPIKGPEGNIEYICHMKNGIYPPVEIDVDAVVEASHHLTEREQQN